MNANNATKTKIIVTSRLLNDLYKAVLRTNGKDLSTLAGPNRFATTRPNETHQQRFHRVLAAAATIEDLLDSSLEIAEALSSNLLAEQPLLPWAWSVNEGKSVPSSPIVPVRWTVNDTELAGTHFVITEKVEKIIERLAEITSYLNYDAYVEHGVCFSKNGHGAGRTLARLGDQDFYGDEEIIEEATTKDCLDYVTAFAQVLHHEIGDKIYGIPKAWCFEEFEEEDEIQEPARKRRRLV